MILAAAAADVWAWRPHPDAWLLATLLIGGYLYALAALGPKLAPGGRAATTRQRVCFISGVVLLWLAADWPLDQLSDSLFSFHMVQHLVFAFLAAPLIILGMPTWLLRDLLKRPLVAKVFRGITRPLVALVVLNLWAAGYHWPALVNLSVTNDWFHLLVHVAWVVAGLVMWWPVLSPLPEFPHLSYPLAMMYLFGQSLVPTVPASFLTFAETPLYQAYAQAPRVLGLDAVTDQQIAGLTMKIGGGLFLWAVITFLFFRWNHEEETGGPDLLYWHENEHRLRESVATSTASDPIRRQGEIT